MRPVGMFVLANVVLAISPHEAWAVRNCWKPRTFPVYCVSNDGSGGQQGCVGMVELIRCPNNWTDVNQEFVCSDWELAHADCCGEWYLFPKVENCQALEARRGAGKERLANCLPVSAKGKAKASARGTTSPTPASRSRGQR
jgi:hypothetical protein